MRGGGEAGGAMTDAWTVGWCRDCVTMVLWLPGENVSWILSGGDIQTNICAAVVYERLSARVESLCHSACWVR